MFYYLLKLIICSGILYAYYHFFLRNEKFHQYNRFYLLGAMLFSIIVPMLRIPISFKHEEENNPIQYFISTGENVIVSGSKQFNWSSIIYVIAGIIIGLMLLRLVLSIIRILKIKKDANGEKIGKVQLYKTSHPDAPFSFFNWLFWNRQTIIESKEGQQILKHEWYHISRKHSWDLLFIELTLCIFWFNPFFYLYRKETKTIQEFLADKYAVQNEDALDYAEMLVLQIINHKHNHLINPFFHHQIKRRIIMLTSSKKPQYQWIKKLLVLPIVAVSILLFAFTFKMTNDFNKNKSTHTHQKLSIKRYLETNIKNEKTKTSVADTIPKKEKANQKPEIFSKVEMDAKYPGNWISFLSRNLNANVAVDNGAPAKNYTVIVQFIVDKAGNTRNIKALTKNGFGMEEEAIRAIQRSGKWTPAIQNGRSVTSYKMQPITFVVMEDSTIEKTSSKIESPKENNNQKTEKEVFTKVEIEPHYPGNWYNFLTRNLNASVGVENGAPKGNYTVIVQFIVDVEGNTHNFKALTKNGFGMEDEAIRVLRRSGKWTPAIQDGRSVTAYLKQPITFQIDGK